MDKPKSLILDIAKSKDKPSLIYNIMLDLHHICHLRLFCIINTAKNHKFGLLESHFISV